MSGHHGDEARGGRAQLISGIGIMSPVMPSVCPRQIRASDLMSGKGKRSYWPSSGAAAPLLDSTIEVLSNRAWEWAAAAYSVAGCMGRQQLRNSYALPRDTQQNAVRGF